MDRRQSTIRPRPTRYRRLRSAFIRRPHAFAAALPFFNFPRPRFRVRRVARDVARDFFLRRRLPPAVPARPLARAYSNRCAAVTSPIIENVPLRSAMFRLHWVSASVAAAVRCGQAARSASPPRRRSFPKLCPRICDVSR